MKAVEWATELLLRHKYEKEYVPLNVREIAQAVLDAEKALEFYSKQGNIINAEEVSWNDPENYDLYDMNYIENGSTASKWLSKYSEGKE